MIAIEEVALLMLIVLLALLSLDLFLQKEINIRTEKLGRVHHPHMENADVVLIFLYPYFLAQLSIKEK